MLVERHGDVELHAAARALLGFGQVLAQTQESLRLRVGLRDDCVRRLGSLKCGTQHVLGHAQSGVRVRDLPVDQRVPRVGRVERVALVGDVRGHQLHPEARHDFEHGEVLADARPLQQAHGMLGAFQPHHDALNESGLREEFEAGRRDDAQRAFRAEEEPVEVITRIVLAQGGQPPLNRFVRPPTPLRRRRPALCVVPYFSTWLPPALVDSSSADRSQLPSDDEGKGKFPVHAFRGLLHGVQGRARFDRDQCVGNVD